MRYDSLPFGKHKGKPWSEVDTSYLQWILFEKAGSWKDGLHDDVREELARRGVQAYKDPVNGFPGTRIDERTAAAHEEAKRQSPFEEAAKRMEEEARKREAERQKREWAERDRQEAERLRQQAAFAQRFHGVGGTHTTTETRYGATPPPPQVRRGSVKKAHALMVIKAGRQALARQYHPDLNKDPAAEEMLKDINQSADWLEKCAETLQK